MEPSTPNQKFFRTAATIVISAVIQAVVFCLMIGLPLPQFFSSRDVESLQFQKLPEQKRTQPVEALENPTPAPQPIAQVEPPKEIKHVKKHGVKKHETEETDNQALNQPQPQPQAAPTEPTKVLVVNFEKSKDDDKKQEETKLVPVSDKLADVQADDSKTEATPDVTENPTDGDSNAAMESMDKTATPSN